MVAIPPHIWNIQNTPIRYASDYYHSSSDTLGIQEALDSLPQDVADRPMGKVIVDVYGDIDAKIILYGGQHLQGVNSIWRNGTVPIPSRLRLADGVNDDMIQITSNGAGSIDQYFPSISDLHLDGNKSNQTNGSCVHVDGQILDLFLQRVITSYAKEDGFRFENANIKGWVKDCYAEYHDRNAIRLNNHYITYLDFFYTYDIGAQGLYINKGTTHITNSSILGSRGTGLYYGGSEDRQLKMDNVNIWGCGSLSATDRYLFDTWEPTNLHCANCHFGERDIDTPDRSKGILLQGGDSQNVSFIGCTWDALKSGYNPLELGSDFPLEELKIVAPMGNSWGGSGVKRYISEFYDDFTLDSLYGGYTATHGAGGVNPALKGTSLNGIVNFDLTNGVIGDSSSLYNWRMNFLPTNNPYLRSRVMIDDVSAIQLELGFYKDSNEYCYFDIDGGDIYLKSDDAGVQGPYSEDSGENVTDGTWLDLMVEMLPSGTGRFKIDGKVVGTPTAGAVSNVLMGLWCKAENKTADAANVELDWWQVKQGRDLW